MYFLLKLVMMKLVHLKYILNVILSKTVQCALVFRRVLYYMHLKGQYTNILSFKHPHIIPNLYAFISSTEQNRRYFEGC